MSTSVNADAPALRSASTVRLLNPQYGAAALPFMNSTTGDELNNTLMRSSTLGACADGGASGGGDSAVAAPLVPAAAANC